MVRVVSIDGKNLMPTNRHGKVRRLLKDNKAKVICKNPFTIQLLYQTDDVTQKITIGVDTGYKFTGFAFIANNKVLQKGTIELRQDVSSLITLRRTLRRGRRNRKTRYRKPRFLNRTRPDGWLAPSTQSKYNHILNWIDRFTKYLPNYQLKVEIANFDIAKINNPDIEKELYQQGNMYGYENIKQYLLAREHGTCQYCKKKKNDKWHIHHIVPKSKGGSDRVDNLALLHESCHKKLHEKNDTNKISKPKQYKDATFMNIIKWKLVNDLKAKYQDKVSFTFGYITKIDRNDLGLEKTHYNDAIAITKEIVNENKSNPIYIKQVRKKKRSLHEATPRKGRRIKNTTQKRSSKNTKGITVNNKKIALYDKVKINNQIGYVSGFTGKMVYVIDIQGNYIKQSNKSYKQISPKEIKHIKRNNNWIIQEVVA